jgi:hypothetical protein
MQENPDMLQEITKQVRIKLGLDPDEEKKTEEEKAN